SSVGGMVTSSPRSIARACIASTSCGDSRNHDSQTPPVDSSNGNADPRVSREPCPSRHRKISASPLPVPANPGSPSSSRQTNVVSHPSVWNQAKLAGTSETLRIGVTERTGTRRAYPASRTYRRSRRRPAMTTDELYFLPRNQLDSRVERGGFPGVHLVSGGGARNDSSAL